MSEEKKRASESGDESASDSVPKVSLDDVWVFDIILGEWAKLSPSLRIQGTGAGKKIRKNFEPRLAHVSCIVDDYVIIFGGLNSSRKALVSNDIYLLSLNGKFDYLFPQANGGKRNYRKKNDVQDLKPPPVEEKPKTILKRK